MKKHFYIVLSLLSFFSATAQIHEVGVFLGGSNFIGDVGKTTYIAPNEPAFGVLYRWNKSPRHAYRFSYTQTNLSAKDLDSKEPSRSQRGYEIENNIKEFSAGLEFNFFDFNLHESKMKVTPYVFVGLSYLFYDELYIDAGQTKKIKNSGTFAIPITLGVKTNLSRSLVLGLEAGPRSTFTDAIDGSKPNNENYKPYWFGNLNNNDWYVFTGATLTYTFGTKPCYCAE